MRKITRHKISSTMINKKMKEVSGVTTDRTATDDYRYRKLMCKDCKFFVESSCSKKRIAVKCAKKGLKNKE